MSTLCFGTNIDFRQHFHKFIRILLSFTINTLLFSGIKLIYFNLSPLQNLTSEINALKQQKRAFIHTVLML